MNKRFLLFSITKYCYHKYIKDINLRSRVNIRKWKSTKHHQFPCSWRIHHTTDDVSDGDFLYVCVTVILIWPFYWSGKFFVCVYYCFQEQKTQFFKYKLWKTNDKSYQLSCLFWFTLYVCVREGKYQGICI